MIQGVFWGEVQKQKSTNVGFCWSIFLLQMLQVFESHAEILGYDTFTLCSLPYLKQIVEKVKEKLGPDAVPMVRV